MNKANIISANAANRLYWLGRYEERVYVTLHLLRKCYDKMIDGKEDDYLTFWQKFYVDNIYASREEFEYGMLYDENNVSSVMSNQLRAMDNAMVLRSEITSETLSYLEMSVAKLRELKSQGVVNITALQQITDWALAFFGSAEQRIENRMAMGTIYSGRLIEYIDALIRFDYPLERLRYAFEGLLSYTRAIPNIVDENIISEIDRLLDSSLYESDDPAVVADTKLKMMKLINLIVRV